MNHLYLLFHKKSMAFLVIALGLFFPSLQAQELKFTLLHTSDEHSTLLPIPLTEYKPQVANTTLGGFARLATKVKQIKKEKGNQPVLLFSSGDIMGGSPFAWLILKGYAAELDIMNAIGYNAMTIGNHEFDYGPEVLAKFFNKGGYPDASGSKMPVIASNLNIPANHSLGKVGMKNDMIFTLNNGLKVGVLGLLGASAYELAPNASPITINDQFVAAQNTVNSLKEKGAQVIVLLSHSGIAEDRLMAKKINGIDIILGGHDHIKTIEPEVVNKCMIVHSGYYLQNLGLLNFSYNAKTRTLKYLNPELKTNYLQPLDFSIPEDSSIAAMIQLYKDSLNSFLNIYTKGKFTDIQKSVIQSNFSLVKHKDLAETTIGNFVVDAMRFVGTQISGDKVDFAFQGNGVIRGDIIPGVMKTTKNNFSLFDLLTISGLGTGPDQLPGYPLVSLYLTEKEIYNVLEVSALLSQIKGDNFYLQMSGLRSTYDPGKSMWLTIPFINQPIPAVKAIKSAELYRGAGIQKANGSYRLLDREGNKLYHVVTDYYLAAFLPMVGEVLPALEIKFKDKSGKEISVEASILKHEGREFKVWEAMALYADQVKNMPVEYKEPQKRIIEEKGIPLAVWSWSLIGLIVVIIIFFILRWRKKKK